MGLVIPLDSFPKRGAYIELPDIAELMTMPMFMSADIDFVYKYGTDTQRMLIDKCGLGMDKQHISIWSNVQFLNPETKSIKYVDRWHIDGSQFPNSQDRLKILVTECTALTEFNTKPMELRFNSDIEHLEFDDYINSNAKALGLTPQKIEPNYVYTFNTRNAHRAIAPKYPEFRYIFRVVESDYFRPTDGEKGRIRRSLVFQKPGESRPSIEHFNNSMVINTN